MAQQVSMGAMLMCSFGAAPSTLAVVVPTVLGQGPPAANTMDHIPMVNIPPFGMCTAPSNPTVAAALGAPMPCVPVIPAPWVPGSPTVLLRGMPGLQNTSKCMCVWGGVIQVSMPGTTQNMMA